MGSGTAHHVSLNGESQCPDCGLVHHDRNCPRCGAQRHRRNVFSIKPKRNADGGIVPNVRGRRTAPRAKRDDPPPKRWLSYVYGFLIMLVLAGITFAMFKTEEMREQRTRTLPNRYSVAE